MCFTREEMFESNRELRGNYIDSKQKVYMKKVKGKNNYLNPDIFGTGCKPISYFFSR